VTPIVRTRNSLATDELPFFFDAVHTALAERAREFAMRVAAPEDDEHRRDASSSFEVLAARCKTLGQRLGKERLIDPCLPASLGGFALGTRREQVDVRSICLVRETLGWASALAEFVFAMQGLGSYPIVVAGSRELREELLPAVLRGESLAAFALTEPDAGSDVSAMRSTAERRGDEYVLNGRKTFISNAGIAGHYVVFAKTDPAAGNRGVSAFVVKPSDPGFVFEGPQALITDHPVGTVRFEDLVLPASRRLGREGEGFKLAMRTLDTFRTTVGAAACGMARRALDDALFRATTREQFGKAIADNQLIQGQLAHMRLLVYRAAWARDTGNERVSIDASMGKWFATEAAQRVIDQAVQIHGGVGVLRGSAVERLYRDIRALRIYEGTSEIHQVIIARMLLGGERARQESRSSERSALSTSDETRPELDVSRTVEVPASLAPPLKTPSQRPTPKRVLSERGEEDLRKTMPEIPARKGASVSRATMPDTPASKLLGKTPREGKDSSE
jgi:acyl-CoA dehydrogenase